MKGVRSRVLNGGRCHTPTVPGAVPGPQRQHSRRVWRTRCVLAGSCAKQSGARCRSRSPYSANPLRAAVDNLLPCGITRRPISCIPIRTI